MAAPRRVVTLCALGLVALVAGCGGNEVGPESIGSSNGGDPSLAYPAVATRNTTRLGGGDSTSTAAAAALAAFPGGKQGVHPPAVTLVERSDWRAGVAAAVLLAAPSRAPVLLTDGSDLGKTTEQALARLDPTGIELQRGAQVLRIGGAAKAGRKSVHIDGADPYTLAAKIDAFSTALRGKPSGAVVIASGEKPAFAMPAAAWAAKSGDPVLFTKRDRLPEATREALRTHEKPRIYALGPREVITPAVKQELRKLGTFKRVAGRDAVANAVAFARYSDSGFGWGIVDPGHGLNFANAGRPLDAAAAAPLSAGGTFGPLLLLERPDSLPKALRDFLLDIQPGYQSDPTRGVYNHGWLMGDGDAISVSVQAQIDRLLEIQRVPGTAAGAGS